MCKGLQMVQFDSPWHLKSSVSSSFKVGWIPFSHYWLSGVIRIGLPSMKVKKFETFQNKRGSTCCKWPNLNTPGTQTPLHHPIPELTKPNLTPSCLSTLPHFTLFSRQRPYHIEYTSSRPITEVKQCWARLVLGWETAWEHWVLLASFDFCTLSVPFLSSGVIRKGSPSIKV